MMMLQELDKTFQAVLLVGYHSGAGAGKSPLEHTMDGGSLIAVKINGRPISEFMIDLYNTAYHHIPLVFVSGDQGLCESVKQLNPHIETVAVKGRAGSFDHQPAPPAGCRADQGRHSESFAGQPGSLP